MLTAIDRSQRLTQDSPRPTELGGGASSSRTNPSGSSRSGSAGLVIHPYAYGSRGPDAAQQVLLDLGFQRNEEYQWDGNGKGKGNEPN